MRATRVSARQGISLVELLVAVALLSVVSVAAFQLINLTETTLVGSQTKLSQQQRSDAISSYIYKDFSAQALNDNLTTQIYQNPDMPDDLRNSGSVTVATLFGNRAREFQGNPVCSLLADIDLESSSFTMKSNCVEVGGVPVASLMNDLVSKGVVLTMGFEGGVGRCSVSKPIVTDGVTGVATIKVDDKSCLARGDDPTRGLAKSRNVLLPRFVAYSTDAPKTFYTSMIESPDIATPDAGLQMPDTYTVIGGGVPNATNIVSAFADNTSRMITVALQTNERDAALSASGPSSVVIKGADTARLSLSGTVASVRTALETLTYRSPSGFMSEDLLTGTLFAGNTKVNDQTKLIVKANCGGQTCGTALMFQLGKTDANGNFQRTRYITSVSKCGTELPSTFYGYCGTSFRFDQRDGSPNTYPETGNNFHLNYCSVAGKLEPYNKALTYTQNVALNHNKLYTRTGQLGPRGTRMLETQKFPYITYSPKFRSYQEPDYVTVFLYEQDSTPLSAVEESHHKSLTENRYSLFFQFDTYDKTGGDVSFQLSNIEKGRVMSDLYDPFTFLDDTSEYFPKVKIGQKQVVDEFGRPKFVDVFETRIGSDGTLSTTARWTKPNDGVVVPLRLDNTSLDPGTGYYELKNYNQGTDRSGSRNPKLSLRSWNGLNGWNIRSTKVTKTPSGYVSEVAWQQFDFNQGMANEQTDFELVVSKAQRCPGPGSSVRPPGSPSPDPDGASPDPDGASPDPDGASPDPDGTSPDPDGASPDPDGTSPSPDG
ncbi:MAG: prepilin-type N-terminal cleavage/methylation domain-containing protein [Candidatus Puniceispirillaceae bacterium]